MPRLAPGRRVVRTGPPLFSPNALVLAPTAPGVGRMLVTEQLVLGSGGAADIGFGQTGLRSGIRTFVELVAESAYDKRPLLEVRPKALVTGWSLFSGSTYQSPYYRAFYRYGDTDQRNDIIRDVVAVQTSLDAGLTRVETLTACVATAGTYYYDYTAVLSPSRWDDGVTIYDAGAIHWDVVPQLYVHLEDNSNPASTNVVAAVGFYFSTVGVTHPHLGEPIFSLASQAAGFLTGTQPTVAGAYYRLAGTYQSSVTSTMTVADALGSGSLALNGRDIVSPGAFLSLLDTTRDDPRRFTFDFIAPSTGVQLAAFSDLFTNVSLRRIYRYNFYEPRLGASGPPTFSAGLNDTLFGGSRVGVGAAQVVNGDGALETDAGELLWINAEARSYFGGVFADGTPLDISDYQRTFNGQVQSLGGTDQSFQLQMEDLKTFYNTLLPPNSYTLVAFSNIDPAFDGKPRPLLFGTVTNIDAVRIDKLSDYGVYEIADCTDSPQGIHSITAVYSYTDSSAAAALDTAKRITLISGTDYTPSLTTGRFTIIRDVNPYVVEATNNKINFDIGAAELTATLTVGLYTATSLAAELQIQLRAAVGGGDTTMSSSYSDTTHKFTIQKSAGTLVLRTSTGTNKDIDAYGLIGFHTDANKTGGLVYVGDEITFVGVDKDHTLRVDAKGYKDDTLGTFTGTASALVEKGPDIVRYVQRRVLKKNTGVDTASFALARTLAPQMLGIYLSGQITTRSLFDKVEFSTLSTISVDGAGTMFYDTYTSSPSVVARLSDADYLSFAIEKRAADVFAQTVVQYAQDPTLGTWQTISTTDTAVALKFGRLDTRTVDTYLLTRADALFNAQVLKTLSNGVARRVKLATKGKLITIRLGQAIALTRARAISPPLNATVFRVVQLNHAYADGSTTAELLEAV